MLNLEPSHRATRKEAISPWFFFQGEGPHLGAEAQPASNTLWADVKNERHPKSLGRTG